MKKNYSRPMCITVPIRGERLLLSTSETKQTDGTKIGWSRGSQGYEDED